MSLQNCNSLIKKLDACFNVLTLSHLRVHAELYQETWLKDAVLAVFSDTRDCSPSMVRHEYGLGTCTMFVKDLCLKEAFFNRSSFFVMKREF